jgi:hypothetical protein
MDVQTCSARVGSQEFAQNHCFLNVFTTLFAFYHAFFFFPENHGEHHKHSAPNPVVTYAAVFLLPFLARCDMIWEYMG